MHSKVTQEVRSSGGVRDVRDSRERSATQVQEEAKGLTKGTYDCCRY